MTVFKIGSKIETDKFFYFFSLLTDRFETLNSHWAELLEKRFGKKFKPIYVLPFKHNKLFEEDNYIVLNQRLFELQKQLNRTDIINLIYPEDLNKQFCENDFIKELIWKLIKKQGKVFILSFTNVWLDIHDPNVVLLGPNAKVAARFDEKIEHVKTFRKLNLHTNQTEIYSSFDELKAKRKEYPFFLSANFSSGGFESKVIYTTEELEAFYLTLRPINKNGSFIATRLIKNIALSPNTNAIITDKNQTTVICISDQIVRGDNKYMGNIYPSQATEQHKKEMADATIKVGNYLSNFGFRGLFGLDFIISKDGNCFPTDLNPRRQGGYYCNVMMSKKVDIIDLELRLALGEKLPSFNYNDFQADYCWAHSKLVPYFNNSEIRKELNDGKPSAPFVKIGSTYKAVYYPKKYILTAGNPGIYITSGHSYQKVTNKLFKEVEKTISISYSTYEGL